MGNKPRALGTADYRAGAGGKQGTSGFVAASAPDPGQQGGEPGSYGGPGIVRGAVFKLMWALVPSRPRRGHPPTPEPQPGPTGLVLGSQQ